MFMQTLQKKRMMNASNYDAFSLFQQRQQLTATIRFDGNSSTTLSSTYMLCSVHQQPKLPPKPKPTTENFINAINLVNKMSIQVFLTLSSLYQRPYRKYHRRAKKRKFFLKKIFPALHPFPFSSLLFQFFPVTPFLPPPKKKTKKL